MCVYVEIQFLRQVRTITLHRHHLLTYTSGLPHFLEKDDVGYFIPAGTIILPNQWCIYDRCVPSWCDDKMEVDNLLK